MRIKQIRVTIVLSFISLSLWCLPWPGALWASKTNLTITAPLVTVAAAAPQNNSTPTVETLPISSDMENRVEIRVSWWGSKRRNDRTIKVIELFEKKNPAITITYEFFSWKDYWSKMEKKAMEGRLPDIMQQDYAMLNRWVKKGWVVPLDAYVKSDMLDLKHVLDASLATGRMDGNLFGISAGTNTQAIVIDVDVFKKAGIELPSSQWSWEDFEQLANKLHEKTGIWAIGERLISPPLIWQSYFLGYGQWAYNESGTGLGYTDDLLINYLNMLLRLQKSGAIPDRSKTENLYSEPGNNIENRLIVSGKSAMDYIWSNQIVALWETAGSERHFKMMPLPRPRGGKPSNYLKPSMFFSLTPGAKHPKQAAMFLDFLTNSLEANEILMADRGVPISFVIRENLLLLLSPAQFEMFVYLSQIEYDNSPTPPPNPPAHGDIVGREFYSDFINPVLFGEVTPEKAVRNFREKTNQILKDPAQ